MVVLKDSFIMLPEGEDSGKSAFLELLWKLFDDMKNFCAV
jgi:hypothetical protein